MADSTPRMDRAEQPPPGDPSSLSFDDASSDGPGWFRQTLGYLPSWLVSLIVHMLLVVVLATWTTLVVVPDVAATLEVTTAGELPVDQTTDLSTANLFSDLPEPDASAAALLADPLDEPAPEAVDPGPLLPLVHDDAPLDAGSDPLADGPLGTTDDGLGQRISETARQMLVESGGGSAQSEAAVRAALRWLAGHQMPDGRWTFKHGSHPDCHGQCDRDGNVNSDVAATAIALLPFLGTGQTHQTGHYRENVARGLEFLVESIRHEREFGSLWDPQGTMYAHGLASIVLCEAYAMSEDPQLKVPAQSVVNYIVDAQDPKGGGWRYRPQMRGDTSVVGWQLMALKSAHMGHLRVPTLTLRRTRDFLDEVQADYGAAYGYTAPESTRPSTTAIGLLCRMYLGWNHRTKALRQGIASLDKLGPSADRQSDSCNLYYDYYGTQVMHHWGGAAWKRWNDRMRDFLVDTQATEGHAAGSWYFQGDHGSGPGGRLYCTAMSTMILEVYYRHLPLYGERSVRQ